MTMFLHGSFVASVKRIQNTNFPLKANIYYVFWNTFVHFWQLNDSFTITITFRKYHFDGVWFSGQANASNVCPNPTLTWGRIMLTTLTWTLTRCHIQLYVGGYESVKTKYVTGYKTLKKTPPRHYVSQWKELRVIFHCCCFSNSWSRGTVSSSTAGKLYQDQQYWHHHCDGWTLVKSNWIREWQMTIHQP